MSAAEKEVTEIGSESDTPNSRMKTRRGVVRGRTPKVGKTKPPNSKKRKNL
jgi:hypothetical protein